MNRNKPATSFIMLNDIHGNTDYIPKLLNNAGFKETDMIIYNGDMMNWLMDEEDLFKGFIGCTVDLFATHKHMYYAVETLKHVVCLLLLFSTISPLRNRTCISC